MLRHAGESVHGDRLRGMIVVLWRAGLRIHEALALAEADLEGAAAPCSSATARETSGREVGIDDWAGSSCGPG